MGFHCGGGGGRLGTAYLAITIFFTHNQNKWVTLNFTHKYMANEIWVNSEI